MSRVNWQIGAQSGIPANSIPKRLVPTSAWSPACPQASLLPIIHGRITLSNLDAGATPRGAISYLDHRSSISTALRWGTETLAISAATLSRLPNVHDWPPAGLEDTGQTGLTSVLHRGAVDVD